MPVCAPVSSQARSRLPASHLYVRRTRSCPPASLLPLSIFRSLMPVWDTARICTPVPTLPWVGIKACKGLLASSLKPLGGMGWGRQGLEP